MSWELFRSLLTDPVVVALNSALAFCVGLLIGNRLAIGRDRRKEFNDAALPIRALFLENREDPQPIRHDPSFIELDLFMQRMRFWKRARFRKAWERYQRAKQNNEEQPDGYGHTQYKDLVPIKESLDRLLHYTRLQ